MALRTLARRGLAWAAVGLLVIAGGCRATTDRIRVLEAEKADAARRNQELLNQQAELRARMIEAQSKAESEAARRRAAEAQAELLRANRTDAPSEPATTVDVGALAEEFRGEGVSVLENEDGGATILLASDITFRSGRADLTGRAQGTLQRVVKALKKTDGIRGLRIEGHTDSDPIRKSGWKDNESLSLARANAVRRYLVAQGLSGELMSVEGLGDARPLAPNTTSQGKAKNRRVEIVLLTH